VYSTSNVNLKKKRKNRATWLCSIVLVGSKPCRWALPSVVRLYPPSLGFTFRRWASPFVVGLHLSSLGSTLRRWASPIVVRLHPLLLGSTLRLWALPFAVSSPPPSSTSSCCPILLMVRSTLYARPSALWHICPTPCRSGPHCIGWLYASCLAVIELVGILGMA
jgi:hypothetical protein